MTFQKPFLIGSLLSMLTLQVAAAQEKPGVDLTKWPLRAAASCPTTRLFGRFPSHPGHRLLIVANILRQMVFAWLQNVS